MSPADRNPAGRTAALVPARDEEESLPELLEGLARAGLGSVLVVDNGSSDGTAAAARAGGAEVVREPRAGYGRACQAGLAALAARPEPPRWVVFVDADDGLAPRQVPRLLAPLASGRAELVIGARRAAAGDGPGRPPVPLHARLGNRLVAAVLRGVYGAAATDPGPFRAAPLAGLVDLALDDPDYGWNVQMEVRALRAGWRVSEVPVAFRGRTAGRSTISGSVRGSARAGVRMLATLAAEMAGPA